MQSDIIPFLRQTTFRSPRQLTHPHPTDSKPFFIGWAVVSFIWVWASMCICVIYPIVESRAAIADVSRGLLRDFFGAVGMRG